MKATRVSFRQLPFDGLKDGGVDDNNSESKGVTECHAVRSVTPDAKQVIRSLFFQKAAINIVRLSQTSSTNYLSLS